MDDSFSSCMIRNDEGWIGMSMIGSDGVYKYVLQVYVSIYVGPCDGLATYTAPLF